MIRNEKEFRRAYVNIIEQAGGHCSMVESPETSPGILDVNWCLRGQEGWSELKFSYKGELPDIRPAQKAWIRRRVRAGGSVNIIFFDFANQKMIVVAGENLPQIESMADVRALGHMISIDELKIHLSEPVTEH